MSIEFRSCQNAAGTKLDTLAIIADQQVDRFVWIGEGMVFQIAKKKRIFGSNLGPYGNLFGSIHQKGFFLKADLSKGIDQLIIFFSSFHMVNLELRPKGTY